SEVFSTLDAGNPLHLQTNDNNSGALVNIKLTDSENYRVWATAMKIALPARNKMGFVDELKDTYDKLDGSILFNLMQKINNYKQNGLPISEYYHKLNSLWRVFDILTKLTPSSCDANAELGKHNQLMNLMQFLMGLDEVYQPISSSLLTQTELHDMKDDFVIDCREESHRVLGLHLGFKTPGHPNGTVAKIRHVGNLRLTSNVDLKKEIVLGTGSESGGLYLFDVDWQYGVT
ncbi:ribonuclease H-like domain-containing protein, partial [Tanacetum coccineum]